jgi:hypothetical protein
MIENDKISIIFYFKMYVHSLINKFSRLLLIKEHLYPNPENYKLSTYEKISIEIANAEALLSRKFHLNIPLNKWQITAREKLIEIAGHKPIKTIKDTVFLNKIICTDDYNREKIYLRVEKGLDIPVTVLKSRQPNKLKRGLIFYLVLYQECMWVGRKEKFQQIISSLVLVLQFHWKQ